MIKNNNKAITLTSLIITIVLLVIISTITLTALDANGIIGKAKESKGNVENLIAKTDEKEKNIEYFDSLGDNLIDDDLYPEYKQFITVWKTTTENEEIIFPFTKNTTPNCIIDWGDGNTETINSKITSNTAHTYANIGEYEVKVTGVMPGFLSSAYTQENRNKLIKLKQWGVVECGTYNFSGCTNLDGEIPDPTKNSFNKLTTLTFRDCINIEKIPAKLFKNCTTLTTLSDAFNRCEKIKEIPEGLFKDCPNLTYLNSVFYNTSIKEIPPNLLDTNNGNPNKINDLAIAFAGTKITSVPEGLFDLCTNVVYFGKNGWQLGGIFQECTLLETVPIDLFKNNINVTDFSSIFRDCKNLKLSLSTEMFKNNINAKYFYRTFYNCPNITGNIPPDMFTTNTKVTIFTQLFNGCTGLTGTIPGNLFANCPEVTTFFGTFGGCKNLEGEIPKELFANNPLVTSFHQTFMYCSKLTGEIPVELFANCPEVLSISSTFGGCSNLSGTVPTELFKNNKKVTSYQMLFYQCNKLEKSELKIYSEGVTNFNSAFPTGLIEKIYLPAGSTTYDTYVAAYGTDNVETF